MYDYNNVIIIIFDKINLSPPTKKYVFSLAVNP